MMKNTPGTLREVIGPDDPAFTPMMRLYEEQFPPDEREPLEVLAESLLPRGADETTSIVHMFVYEEQGYPLGFHYFSYLRDPGIGYSVYLAVEPTQRGRGIGELLYRASIDRCRKDTKGKLLPGVIMEVERIEDMPCGSKDRELRINRIRWFNRQGAIRITATYVQPALKPGKSPVPLNLLWHALDGGIGLGVAVEGFCRAVYDLEPGHELVQRAVRGIDDLAFACSTLPYP